MERPSPYTVYVGTDAVSVRVMLIAQGVFEALGRYGGTDFIVKGTSVDDALERFRRAVENRNAFR